MRGEVGTMVSQWIAMEHYRMHLVEGWPESDLKLATLASIRASIASLGGESFGCSECRRKQPQS